MDLKNLRQSSTSPYINACVGATCISVSLVVRGNAAEGSLWASIAENTLPLLLVRWAPLAEVLHTSGPQVVDVVLPGKGEVEDGVWTTFASKYFATTVNIEDLDIMVIAFVSSRYVGGILGDGASTNSPGILLELESIPLLSSLGIPNKDRWALANLPSHRPLSITSRIDSQTHDVIAMTRCIASDLFRLVLNLNTSKEHLSILFFFQDDSEPSRHVDDISIWIIKYILS